MQTLITSGMSLPQLLTLSAAARQAFAERRRMPDNMPDFQVKPAGRSFFHVFETATGKVRGYRQNHRAAIELAEALERQGRPV